MTCTCSDIKIKNTVTSNSEQDINVTLYELDNKNKSTITLQFEMFGKVISRTYCRENIMWFAQKVKDNIVETEKLCHDPSECNLTHYNPKYFNHTKLCGYSLARIPCPFGIKCNMLHSLNFPQIVKSTYNDTKEKIIIDNSSTYNSAGVLLLSKNDSEELCVNLFKSAYKVTRGKNTGYYYSGIAGGGINEDDETVEAAACRELNEESCKTVLISSSKLKMLKKLGSYVEIVGKTLSGKRKAGLFACYVCKLPSLAYTLEFHFNDNKDIINKGNFSYAFNETTNLVKIPIKDIKSKISNLNYTELKPMSFLVNGVNEFVDERTLKCLWKIINENSYGDDFNNFETLDDFEYYCDEEGINTFHF